MKVGKEAHLVAIVLSVVLDVALVRSQLLNKNLLLSQLYTYKLAIPMLNLPWR